MSIKTKIEAVQNQVTSVRPVGKQPFYPEALVKKIETFNDSRAKLIAEINEACTAVTELISDASSGSCSRIAGVVGDLQKLRAKVPQVLIKLVNLLNDKGALTPEAKEAYKAEAARYTAIETKRNKELDKITAGMIAPTAHGVRLTDQARVAAENGRRDCQRQINNGELILTKEEASLLDSLKAGLAAQF